LLQARAADNGTAASARNNETNGKAGCFIIETMLGQRIEQGEAKEVERKKKKVGYTGIHS